MPEARYFLYKIQATRPEMVSEGPTSEEDRVVSEHFDYLKRLTEEGIVLLAGRTLNTDYSTFGIVIIRAESEAYARQVMQNDPAVKRRIMRAELYPFRIALLGQLGNLIPGSESNP